MANRLAPSSELAEQTRDWAGRLAAAAPLAQRHGKEILRRATRESLAGIIALEARCQAALGRSRDALEGVRAFFEKRPAAFTGE